jgi:hypothetical protein
MEALRQFRVGEDVTLVSEGYVNGSGRPYIDPVLVGRTSYMHITRIGQKYLYGNFLYPDNDGKLVPNTWEAKADVTHTLIHHGVRTELREAYSKYRDELAVYEVTVQCTRREMEQELQDELNRKLAQWQADHPRPKPPTL